MPLKTMWLILTTPSEPDQSFLIDLVAAEQFGVVAEIAQEPAELPQGFRGAIEPARE